MAGKARKSGTRAVVETDRTFVLVFLSMLVLHLILICSSRLYPFIDIPNHLAAATIFKHFGEQSNRFMTFYLLDLFPRPNVFHLFFCSLGVFGTIEWGNTLYYCLYVSLLPISVYLVIRKSGGNQWLTLLVFPLLYNYNVSWGFVGFSFAIPFFLLLFYLMLDCLRADRWWNVPAVALMFLGLFFIHGLVTLFALFVFVICCLWTFRRSIMLALRKCLVLIPVLLLYFSWWQHKESLSLPTYLYRYFGGEYWSTVEARLSGIFLHDNYFLFPGMAGDLVALFFSLSIVAALIWGFIRYRRNGGQTRGSGRRAPLIILAGAALLCCLIVPHYIPGIALLYQRFSVFLLIALVLLAGIFWGRRIAPAVKIALVVIALAHFALWADYFRDFNRENASFNENIFPRSSIQARLGGVIYDYQFRGEPIRIHFQNYYIIWRRGIATTSIIDYRDGAIRRQAGMQVLPFYNAWVGKHNNYDGRYSALEYILVGGEVPEVAINHFRDFTPVRQSLPWTLYQRTGKPQSP